MEVGSNGVNSTRKIMKIESKADHYKALDLWRPIETAPKDGTEIIVSGGIWGSDSVSCEFEAKFKKSACVSWDDGSFNRWCEVDDKTTYYRPTHWMPMPEPVYL